MDTSALLLDVFGYFPETAETAAYIIMDWIDAQLEMLRRLSRGREFVRMIIRQKRSNARVVSLRLGLSDPHDGGRSVAIVKFEGGGGAVYKPRSSDGERIWFAALRWMNQQEFPMRFRIPKILSRRRFFWMEFLPRKDCNGAGAVRRFYFRWGAQAALAQVLGMEDLHRDNWLACGENPVLLDAEMACQPHEPYSAVANWARLNPLLRTGLLPIYKTDGVGFYRGIAPLDTATSRFERLDFWPSSRRKLQPPSKFVDDLIKGYRTTMQLISVSNRGKRFFAQIIRLKEKARHRIIYRATAEYSNLLRESYSPKYMLDRGARLEHLKRRLSSHQVRPEVKELEVDALFRACIPRFAGSSFKERRVANTPFAQKITDSSRLLRLRIAKAGMRSQQCQARSLRDSS